MSTQEPLLALAFSFDRFAHSLSALDVFGPYAQAEAAAIGEGPLEATGRLGWSLPKGATLDLKLRLSVTLKRKRRVWEGPLRLLRDATQPRILVSLVAHDAWRGRLRVGGWLIGIPPEGRLALFAGGSRLAPMQATLRRPDVHARFPLLPLTCGFDVNVTLDGRTGPFEMRATLPSGLPLALAPVQEPEGMAQAGPPLLPRLRERARAIPRPRLEALIASEAFRRRWQAGVTDGPPPDGACLIAREAIAAELAGRLAPGEEIAVRLTDGDLVRCSPVDDPVLARLYLAKGSDELGFLRWLAATVQPGDTVIDGGAAYGVMSRTMARRGAHVLAIEADPVAADRLRRIGLDVPPGRIELVEAALAAQEGSVVFAGMGASLAGSGKVLEDGAPETVEAFVAEIAQLGQVNYASESATASERRRLTAADVQVGQVRAVTLDGLCERHGLRDVALVKLDIEGGELEALRGAAGLLSGAYGRRPRVAFEYSDLFPTRGGRREEILERLWAQGYTVWRLREGKSGGGPLVAVKDAASAPSHDNLIALPPQQDAR